MRECGRLRGGQCRAVVARYEVCGLLDFSLNCLSFKGGT